MAYKELATSAKPALVIYVLDLSASMQMPMAGRRRLDVVTEAFQAALIRMVDRSTRGRIVAPRYRVGLFGYSDKVYDILDGVKTVDVLARMGFPRLTTMRTTDTALALEKVYQTLKEEIPNLQDCPAPVVCHMTDGEYTGDDPTPWVDAIRGLQVKDGAVLFENIFIADDLEEIHSPQQWPGVSTTSYLKNPYAQKLRDLSSPLPEEYRKIMAEYGYHLQSGAVMMLPGSTPELVSMGFQMSAATPVK